MQISVKIPQETPSQTNTIEVEIEKTNTVGDIKQKIYEKEGTLPDDQRIIYDGKQLQDEVVLYEYEIKRQGSASEPNDLTIHMVRRLRGGGNEIWHPPRWNSPSSGDADGETPLEDSSDKSGKEGEGRCNNCCCII